MIDACGCCQGVDARTPLQVSNPPGLAAIAYRAGDHARFKATMLAGLTSRLRPGLVDLSARDDSDASIALIDAWAAVGDVLTFYQERIANESYLRTATERVSILELARLIGYELRPGVAASAQLAFTLETAEGTPRRVPIATGTKVMSVPGPDERPQTFETVEDLTALPELTALRPRLLQPQAVKVSMEYVVVNGLAPPVATGDTLLVEEGGKKRVLKTVMRVVPDGESGTTRLEFVVRDRPKPQAYTAPPLAAASPLPAGAAMTGTLVAGAIVQRRWDAAELISEATALGWSLEDLAATVRDQLHARAGAGGPAVYAFRTRASIFGHNAPDYDSLPPTLKVSTKLVDAKTGTEKQFDAPYPNSWENRKLTADAGTGNNRRIYLDAVYPHVIPAGWVALVDGATAATYPVTAVAETSRTDFTISAKVTELTIDVSAFPEEFKKLTMRGTSVAAQSERLDLADVSIPDPVKGDRILLDDFQLGITAGRKVIVTGELADARGVVASEVAIVHEATIEGGRTSLKLEQALASSYVRDTVTINANVALSTHGESKAETLGSGEGSQPYQRFTLRDRPLTYVSAPTASGVESTLAVRVDGVLWHETPSLYGRGPGERVYVTRLADDGTTSVQFGDGRAGARVPTGAENVTAAYRKGIGRDGLVKASQLSLLTTKPLGVKGVNNPLDAAGAADPEPREQARANAPRTVLTLDRVVSATDYEDFARSFAGIAKALETELPGPSGDRIVLTVAGTDGAEVKPGSELYAHLANAIVTEGDVAARFRLESYRPVFFRVKASVAVDPDHLPEKVLAAVERALRSAFSFDARQLGAAVAESQVIALVQTVPGVNALDLEQLYRSSDSPALVPHVWADVPAPGQLTPPGAELLMLDPRPVELGVMT